MWTDHPGAGAEILRDAAWVWTPIPSGIIVDHPLARELSPAETAQLDLPA